MQNFSLINDLLSNLYDEYNNFQYNAELLEKLFQINFCQAAQFRQL